MSAQGIECFFKFTIWFNLHPIEFIDLKLSDNKYNTDLNHISAKSQGVFKINLTAILNIKSVSISNIN